MRHPATANDADALESCRDLPEKFGSMPEKHSQAARAWAKISRRTAGHTRRQLAANSTIADGLPIAYA